jgi:hypothetical protein
MLTAPCPLLGCESLSTFPQKQTARNNRTSVARQRSGKHAFVTIRKAVFSMGPPREYLSNPLVNQNLVLERERDWSEPSAVKEEEFG